MCVYFLKTANYIVNVIDLTSERVWMPIDLKQAFGIYSVTHC